MSTFLMLEAQAQRDHWFGRAKAAEAKVQSLLVENERFREALGQIAGYHDDWDPKALSNARDQAYAALHGEISDDR